MREDGLSPSELIAGGAGPSQGPALSSMREDGLSPSELIAGGAGPSQGPALSSGGGW